MLELRDLTFAYTATSAPVLRGVALVIEEGELLVVAGRTGIGKSTLLGVLNGLVPSFTGGLLTGDVLLDGISVLERPPRERADVVGYVGQDPTAGFVTDTVEEELAYGMEQLGLDAATMRRRVEETLDLLGIADLRNRDLRTLSGGQQQRVAIGSVLTMHPRVLVLDEPTSALDPRAEHDLFSAVRTLLEGRAAILVSHRYSNLHLADRIYVLQDGRVVEHGPHEELMAREGVYAQLYRLQADAYDVTPRRAD
jgi:energy-coupling factor transporter ATP-binding protein EcfA2